MKLCELLSKRVYVFQQPIDTHLLTFDEVVITGYLFFQLLDASVFVGGLLTVIANIVSKRAAVLHLAVTSSNEAIA